MSRPITFDVVTTVQGALACCSICKEIAPVVHLPVGRKTGEPTDLWLGLCLPCVEAMRRSFHGASA